MRIVHIVDHLQPKLGYQEYFLALTQSRQGHRVSVLTSDRYYPYPNYAAHAYPLLGPRVVGPGRRIEEGIQVQRLRCRFEYSGRAWLEGLEGTLQELDPDVVFVHGIPTFSALRVALLRKQKREALSFRVIIDSHMVEGASRHPLRHLAKPLIRAWARVVCSQADVVVGVADDAVRYIRSVFGVKHPEIHMIPLGVSTERFSFDASIRERVRRDLGYSENDIVAVYAGKLHPVKGTHLLVRAALRAIPFERRLRILMIGGAQPSFRREMEAAIRRAALMDSFKWLPTVPNSDLRDYYVASDFGVWPRLCSLTVLEAMSCAVPVVVSDHPVAKERVEHGGGIVFRSEDELDLSEKILELAGSAELRKRLGLSGATYVKSSLSYTQISDQFLGLIGADGRRPMVV